MAGNESLINLILLLILSCSCASQSPASDTLKQGDSSQHLVSANGKFKLGILHPMYYNNNNKSHLCICYSDDYSYEYDWCKDPVWIGNRDTGIVDDSVLLTTDNRGKLMIKYNGSKVIIELYSGESAAAAANTSVTLTLLDSGNLVLREVYSDGSIGRVLWESFDYPTDTLLPGMKLGVNYKTGRNWSLTSWLAEDEPSSGAFTLHWDPKALRLVIKQRGVDYWSSGMTQRHYWNSYNTYNSFESAGQQYIINNVSNADEDYFTYSLDQQFELTNDWYEREKSQWRLDYQGQMHDEGYLPIMKMDYCYGYGMEDEGCERWKQPECRSHNQWFELRSGSFQNGGMIDDNASLGPSDCRAKCWNDCDCMGFLAKTATRCVFYRGNLKFAQDNTGSSIKKYVLITDPSHRNAGKKWKWIGTAIAIALLVFPLGIFYYVKRKWKQRGDVKREKEKYLLELTTPDRLIDANELESDGNQGQNIKVFSFAYIAVATDNFSLESKLGEGGFGPVYKGKLLEGREIAVKRLSRSSGQGLVELKNELIIISKLQHKNLVRLFGCCFQGEEKMLIYEYMPNKSLDFFLFDPFKKVLLDWEKRVYIIDGIAQGLLYLHKYSRLKIIHRDLKASNILLDKNMNPKISDFGMARIFKQDGLEANTKKTMGTYGYMSPEYAMKGIFSEKSDVFSFGVLMLEIASGRKNNSFYHVSGPLNLVGYAWELWQRGDVLDLMDPTLKDSCPRHQLLRFIHVALSCVEDCAPDRPTIPEVISMLTNESMPLPLLKKPAFLIVSNGIGKDLPTKESINSLSISMMDAR